MTTRQEFQTALFDATGGKGIDFEGLVRDVYVSFLKPGDAALDVGVNRGDHLVQMAMAVGPKGLVIGIEAAPQMIAVTRNHIAQGRYDERCEIVLHNVAVSDSEGTAQFHYVKTSPGLSGLVDRALVPAADMEVFDCRVTTIDRLMSGFGRKVAFMKMDIEGAEYHALKGASQFLARDRPPLTFEFNAYSPPSFNYDCADLTGLFEKLDYEIQDLFGFTYSTPQELMESRVWDYFAAPREDIGRYKIRELGLAALKRLNIAIPIA